MTVDEHNLTKMFRTPKLSKEDLASQGKIYRAGKVFARAIAKEGGGSESVFAKVKEAALMAIDAANRS